MNMAKKENVENVNHFLSRKIVRFTILLVPIIDVEELFL